MCIRFFAPPVHNIQLTACYSMCWKCAAPSPPRHAWRLLKPTIEHFAVLEIIAMHEKPDGRYVTHTVPDLSLRVRYIASLHSYSAV